MKAGFPSISAIIPVRNGAAFISDAVESILAQDLPVCEILVIDDGSTDGSAAAAARYPLVRAVSQPPLGLAAARNRGLAEASGHFIAFLDADDLWLPAKLSRQAASLEGAQDRLSITMVRHVAVGMAALPAVGGPEAEPVEGRLMSCIMAARPVFAQVGAFDGRTLTRGDQDWFLRAEDAGIGTVLVPEVLAIRRIHGKNHSILAASSVAQDFLALARRRINRRRGGGVAPDGM